MSRFGGESDENFPNQAELWWANFQRHINGKRGQRDLRAFEEALLALPEKRLIYGRLAKGDEVCAVGAYVLHCRVEKGETRDAVLAELRDAAPVYCATCYHAQADHADGECVGCVRQIERHRARDLSPEQRERYKPIQCSAFVDSDETEDYGDITMSLGQRYGLTTMLAWAIGYANDEEFNNLTPEDRYEATLAWVRKRIVEPVAA